MPLRMDCSPSPSLKTVYLNDGDFMLYMIDIVKLLLQLLASPGFAECCHSLFRGSSYSFHLCLYWSLISVAL